MNKFSKLPLSEKMLKNLELLKYTTMTPIQAESLPLILDNKDIIAQAKTGSGKTAAFGIGLLSKLKISKNKIQSLIICPTRELTDQVAKELRRIAKFENNIKILTLCGGESLFFQEKSLSFSAHIIVGTPGRLLKLLNEKSLDLSHVETLVLDEADRMLDMGFHKDISSIISFLPDKRQTILFSATFTDNIQQISKKFQNKAVKIAVDEKHSEGIIEQLFYKVDNIKNKVLPKLFSHYQIDSALVFCNTKKACKDIADLLNKHKISSLAINGDMEQRERMANIVQFANKSCSVLVATDVAARGLDIKDLPLVINYDLSPNPDIHIHRIGRTGRAGKEGLAITLCTSEDTFRLKEIEDFYNFKISFSNVASLKEKENFKLYPPMATLYINGGRKNKIRPCDILGALTGAGIAGSSVGKIDIFDQQCFVAIETSVAAKAVKLLENSKIKAQKFKIGFVNVKSS